MHIKRPILKPCDKDKFELVHEYEIEICKTQNKNAKVLRDDDLDCDVFLDLDKQNKQNKNVNREVLQGLGEAVFDFQAERTLSFVSIANQETTKHKTARQAGLNKEKITIPKGYKTNGADIPRLFWAIYPPNSPEYLSAVVVHDYLCDEAEKIYKLGFKPKAKERFKFADVVLKQMLLELGCSKLKANIFYYACRAYHKIKYKEY